MPEYIDRKKIRYHFEVGEDTAIEGRSVAYKTMIDSMPTEDVVPVVRCKDCKHSFVNEYHEEKPLICCMTMMCGTVKPDYYCWQGEGKCDDARDFV